MAIFKTRQPLSTLDIITISFNVLQTSGIFVKKKKSKHNINETRTVYTEYKRWRLCWRGNYVLEIIPTGFGKRLMGQTSAKASVLVISSLKSIVEERSWDNLGSLWTKQWGREVSNDFRFSWRLLMQEVYRDPERSETPHGT